MLRHPGETQVVAAPRQRYRRRTNSQAKDESLTSCLDDAASRQRKRAADCRVSRHRELVTRREDAEPEVGFWYLRRQKERRLGEIHLLGDRLHHLVGQAPAVERNGELISA